MASSLSSVVSNLVRASMGSAVSSTVTDEDLDRHVAELILKEAKKKAERYGQQGIRAFLRSGGPSDSNAPRTNKRFLSSIIRSTDDHNKTILRAQALAAQEIKREREEQERRERRARAEEAAEAERLRRSGRSRRRRSVDDRETWDRWDGRSADRKRKARNWETWDEDEDEMDTDRRKRRHRSRSREHHKERGEPSKHSSSRSRRKREQDSSRPRRERSSDRKGEKYSSHRRNTDHSSSRTKLHKSYSPPLDEEDSRNKDRRHSRRHRSRSRHRSHRSGRKVLSESSSRRSPSSSISRTDESSSHKQKRARSPKYALDDLDTDSPSPRRSPRRSPSLTYSIDEDQWTEPHRDILTDDVVRPVRSSKRSHSRGRSTSFSPDSKRPKTGSSSSKTVKTHSVASVRSRSATPGPIPAVQLPSKMDKYFEETYDPRLDVAPLTVPQVPATGLINNADFEGWDAMLELLRVRREDKEERKRMERLGLTKDKAKDKKKGASDTVGDRWAGEGVSIMEIEYKKRGSVREWDLGKEGF